MIASDLDGTLFDADHQLAQPTVAALRRARSVGIKVVAATGRAPLSAMERLAPHDVVDALICSNGSIVHDVHTDDRAHHFPIAPEHVAEIFSSLDAAIAGLSYCWELPDHCAWDAEFDVVARTHEDLGPYRTGPRPNGSTSVTKIMVRHDTLVRQDLAHAIRPHLPAPLTIGSSGVEFVEITGVGIDKSTALEHVVSGWGFDAGHVVAFGDNHNDIEMLHWAGHGVAVANAVDAAHAAADEVIGHHAEHSVADYVTAIVDHRDGATA